MNLKNALAEFLIAQQADQLKATTVDWYRSLLTRFVDAHCEASLTEISTTTMRLYIVTLNDRYTSEDTRSAHIRALHKFWGWCSKEYQIINPMRSIKYPKKPEPKPKAIPLEHVARMFETCGDDVIGVRNRALLALLIDTGARTAGLLGLKPEDLFLDERNALVTEKGRKTRRIVFTEYTTELVGAWMAIRVAAAPTVFYNFETLKPLTRSGLRGILVRIAKRAGVTGKVNPHAFRHAFAREYLRARGDLSTLSKLMGHSHESSTLHYYAQFTPDEVAQAHDRYSPMNRLRNKNAPDNSEAY
jgi:integrase/recombinase XerC